MRRKLIISIISVLALIIGVLAFLAARSYIEQALEVAMNPGGQKRPSAEIQTEAKH